MALDTWFDGEAISFGDYQLTVTPETPLGYTFYVTANSPRISREALKKLSVELTKKFDNLAEQAGGPENFSEPVALIFDFTGAKRVPTAKDSEVRKAYSKLQKFPGGHLYIIFNEEDRYSGFVEMSTSLFLRIYGGEFKTFSNREEAIQYIENLSAEA